jgi:hypothetical protein
MPNDTKAKYHHLVPQTYMSAWAKGKGTLNVEFLNNPGVACEKNKENIAGITDYHSIKAGMPICTQADTDQIFAMLQPYRVEYDSKTIRDTREMNSLFFDFEKWNITRADGSPVSKKSILREIQKVKIKDIEANWSSKYENGWAAQVAVIEQSILNATTDSVPAFDREYIMKFFTALDWRGFSSNAQFEEATTWLCNDIMPLGELDIPEEDRVLPSLTTAAEEMRHNLLLQYYIKFLNDTAVIYQDAMARLKHTSFHFLVADGPSFFITSDTPASIHKRADGSLVGLLPITPRILLAQGRNTDQEDVYYVSHITEDEVQRYNAIIRDNAEEFVILNW